MADPVKVRRNHVGVGSTHSGTEQAGGYPESSGHMTGAAPIGRWCNVLSGGGRTHMGPRYALWVVQADWLTDHPVVIIGAFILIALVLAGRYLERGRRG